MSRLARVVIPNVPHHIIQRGHRRQRVFFCDEDRQLYMRLLKKYGDEEGLSFWVYCLMDNHVHLIAVPEHPDSFRRGLGIAHWKYSFVTNLRKNWKGYLWQGRFQSYPLGGSYLCSAVKYIEMNPVRAEIVGQPEDYAWSSARAHVMKKPDRLLSDQSLTQKINDWKGFLACGIEESELRLLRRHASTGRPLGDEKFIEELERLTGRPLKERKRGRKPK